MAASTYAAFVSTHSRLKAAGLGGRDAAVAASGVSTHSRLKAAGQDGGNGTLITFFGRFNTQPPEGGWRIL